MPEKFSLLGVDGLLLPGTVERPCPGHEDGAQLVAEAYVRSKNWELLTNRAATAACWYRAKFTHLDICGVEEDQALDQWHKWQLVFERACERMVKT